MFYFLKTSTFCKSQCPYYFIQDDGEINYFTINKLNNDNDKPENLWTLQHQVSEDWVEGRVEVSSEGDKEYQVKRIVYS